VSPSGKDTFGSVVLEALACSVPAAACPVGDMMDIVKQGVTGYLDEDLVAASMRAPTVNPGECREFALRGKRTQSAQYFLENLLPASKL